MGNKDIVSGDYMADNEHFADAFNFLIYGGEKVIKSENLYAADAVETAIVNKLDKIITTKKTRDVIRTLNVKHGNDITYVLLGIENQSDIHYAMPVRNLLYDALNYASQVSKTEKELRKTRKKAGNAEFLSGFTKDGRIFPVITLVINWSDKRWDGPRKLSDMFAETDSRIMEFVNDYELKLIDPHDITDFGKFNTMLGDVLEFIKYQNDEGYFQRALREKGEDWELDIDSINVINTFTDAKIAITGEKEGTMKMCRATEAILEQGIEQGTNVVNQLNQILIDAGRLDDLKRATKDKEYQNKLIEELITPMNKV